ncbi:hypothetical protein BJV77DRAFT_805862 [Russula vinacea]|nr:hypothetical protein BJV77DRAFT_805862 [Russula vinacea]
MEDAMPTHPGKQSFVNDFTAFLLKMMDYNDGIRAVCQWRKLKFEMCGKHVDAKVDICITEHSESGDYAEHLLVMQEAKHYTFRSNPEPQLIAGAMAALSENNRACHAAGLPLIQSKTFPGIIMFGTTPIFYKIPVRNETLTSIATSQYPPQATTVERLIPPISFPGGWQRWYEAIKQPTHYIAVL